MLAAPNGACDANKAFSPTASMLPIQSILCMQAPSGIAASVHHIGKRDAAVALNGLACGGLQNHLSDQCELKS